MRKGVSDFSGNLAVGVVCALLPQLASATHYGHLDFEPIAADGTTGMIQNTAGRFVDYHPYGYAQPNRVRTYSFTVENGGLPPITVVRSPDASPDGKDYAVRISTNPTPASASPYKDRSEIYLAPTVYADHGFFMKFDVFIPYDPVNYPLPTDWFMLMQVRESTVVSRTPVLSISYVSENGGKLVVVGRNSQTAGTRLLEIPWSQKLNHWATLVLYFKLGPSGEAAVFNDGAWSTTKAFDFSYSDACAPSGCTGTYGQYTVKFGIYRGGSTKGMYLDFDNVSFYDKDQVTATSPFIADPSAVPNYGCFVEVENCPRMKREDWLEFSDINVSAHSSSAACGSRARVWYNSCAANDLPGSGAIPRMARTRYLSSEARTYETVSAHGCVLTLDYCPSQGVFARHAKLDPNPASHTNPSICAADANTNALACKAGLSAGEALEVNARTQYFSNGAGSSAWFETKVGTCVTQDTIRGGGTYFSDSRDVCTTRCLAFLSSAQASAFVYDCRWMMSPTAEQVLLPGRAPLQ